MASIDTPGLLGAFVGRQSDAPVHSASRYERQHSLLVAGLLVLDALMVLASLKLAFALRISSGLLTYTAPYEEGAYFALVLISVPVWLGLFAVSGLYRQDNLMGGNVEYQLAAKACGAGVILLVILSFFSRDVMVISRIWLILSWVFSSAFVLIGRFLARRLAYLLRRHGWFTARVLIVGANDQGIAMAEQWMHSSTSGMQVVGFVDDFKPAGTAVLQNLKVVGRPTALAQLVKQTGANEVVVVPNGVAWETFEELIAQASAPKDYTLRISTGFYEMLTASVAVTNKTFVPLFTINEARIVGVDATLKDLLDIVLGLALLAVVSPVIFALGVALKLSNWHGSILSRHHTVGQSGATFSMLKFNTAVLTAKLHRGGTLSWLERALYYWGLDKLPQLLNVLMRQMSLVGPRPRVIGGRSLDPRKVSNLSAVRPGVIGPWLVRECWSCDESHDELYYVRNWTIWLDLQILVQAAMSLFRARWMVQEASTGQRAAPYVSLHSHASSIHGAGSGVHFSSASDGQPPAQQSWNAARIDAEHR